MNTKKSTVEAIAGNTALNVAVNAAAIVPQVFPAIGAMVGASAVPLLSAVPFLLQTLAAGRHEERIMACFKSLSEQVEELRHRIDLNNITDDQYKLASECSLAFFSTINAAKLGYLRQAVLSTLTDASIADGTSEALGRLIRDISAQETELVIALFKYNSIAILDEPSSPPATCYAVLKGTNEELAVGGLIRLGLLYSLTPTWDYTQYTWSPLAAKLIALVQSGKYTGTP